MKTSTLKKWGFFLYFFMTGWGLFWVISFVLISGVKAQSVQLGDKNWTSVNVSRTVLGDRDKLNPHSTSKDLIYPVKNGQKSIIFLRLFSPTLTANRPIKGILSNYPPHPLNSDDNQFIRFVSNNYSDFLPNINQISFSSFPPVKVGGTIQLQGNIIQQLGFDPNRIWQAGQKLDTIIQLGDISDGFGVENFNLNQIKNLVNIDVNNLSLQNFGVIQFQTIGSLVNAIPTLQNKSLCSIIPLRDLVVKTQCDGKLSKCQKLLKLSVKKAITQSNLDSIQLNQLPLNQYKLTDIPGLLTTPLNQFQQWQQVFIFEIPGLSSVPFSKFPKPLGLTGTQVAQIDIAFSQAENKADRSISGSYQEGFDKACFGGCAHIELGGNPLMLGKQWISGNSQKVKGGNGILGNLFGGKEPTGRHPFGSGFKVVIGDINEATATVETNLYFRICRKGLINLGCSPYAIGPFPFLSFKEQDWIFLGN